ncbi:RNA-guided endonuclease InsQ/TnpB family protein [Vibrio crassostreae]|uniref:RNA-guided endonuclease InsQ/TnpB family protein n=1 Tax=Vibrio crassostreae TaxID=246167 RepID=UPI001B3097CD|nr:RNA-guided endonuclease TnpB family protein [Vibrio crassostreae]
MKIQKAFLYKLEPEGQQIQKLYQMAGCGRVIYNKTLDFLLNIARKQLGGSADNKAFYKQLNELSYDERITLVAHFPHSNSLNKLITEWKKDPKLAWLKEAYTDNLQQRQRDLRGSAMDEWVKGKRGFPIFRQRKKAHHSTMRFVQFQKYCKLFDRHIQLPNKLGKVRFRNSRPIEGKPKNATVSLNACGEWHVSIMCEVKIQLPDYVSGEQCGIDMGIAKNMTVSTDSCGDEGVFYGVHSYRVYQSELAKAQKKLSRMELGSNNWMKQKRKVSRIHQKIANIRKDYQHKATTEISKKHAMVICEALKVKNMSKSAKGDSENHGKNVAAKSGLNKSILDEGWGELRRQLKYKMEWSGGFYDEVNPVNSSRECPICGHISAEHRTEQAHFECVNCNHAENADKHASKVILQRGLDKLEQPLAA